MPERGNPANVDAILVMGEVVIYGADIDGAREHAEKLAAESGSRYLHPGNEPALIAGVATETLEILEDQPSIEPAGAAPLAAAMRLVTGSPAGESP